MACFLPYTRADLPEKDWSCVEKHVKHLNTLCLNDYTIFLNVYTIEPQNE